MISRFGGNAIGTVAVLAARGRGVSQLSQHLMRAVFACSNCSQCLVAHSIPESGPKDTRDLIDDVLRFPLVFQYFITDSH